MANELTRLHVPPSRGSDPWSPAINVYRCGPTYVVCVELAGVRQDAIEIRADHRRLTVRGVRVAPGPPCDDQHPVQALAMEIDYGRFSREVQFPEAIDPVQVRAEQTNGLLWIHLPILTD